ncbi:DNA cytosine methyltransferase [Clostridium fungisolvens]|uniref:DNA (cytosine-5-)-methyltransferase n=1 Tax=Clostridium fungisolvens TaxID=1604897 RepID=A0A6V8SGS3_9CLOT|nr:DNA cytosine methyltransferase [Clostridium fungisolvens]GFP76377.1 Modification methylase BspRI [Clostridium fungisolvens]
MQEDVLTYISIFSSAGIGCYGFKEEGFECIATNELLEKRMKIQRYNDKCRYDSGYILGDIKEKNNYKKILEAIDFWKIKHNIKNVDVLIATPPCQGMSVANHKKNLNEHIRNSLVIESIKVIKDILPNFIIIENVRSFLNTICTDIDGKDKKIKDAIDDNLSHLYNLSYNILNFKDYGCPSSRTRTLIIGVRNTLSICPDQLLPERTRELPLREVIGNLPSLKVMGEIDNKDLFHSFKRYQTRMLPWIEELKEGQSAFDNTDNNKVPHTIKNGTIIFNKKKNADKYRRQYWDKVAPCIHTRNDILSSQNTIHPNDNRVFSIRELMLMMSIPYSFKWTKYAEDKLNKMPLIEKQAFLKQEEMNIRQSIGEAVPTIIFKSIAKKIKKFYF